MYVLKRKAKSRSLTVSEFLVRYRRTYVLIKKQKEEKRYKPMYKTKIKNYSKEIKSDNY